MKKGDHESKIKGNSLGASGFTLGIVAILSMGWFGVVISAIGFALCLIQQKNKSTKLGKIGIILNVLGFILSIIWVIYIAPRLTEIIQSLSA